MLGIAEVGARLENDSDTESVELPKPVKAPLPPPMLFRHTPRGRQTFSSEINGISLPTALPKLQAIQQPLGMPQEV